MLPAITVLTSLVCVMLMGVVLIQNPKGGGVDATFGGQASNQIFGEAKSTDFIEKLTWGLAIALFVLCIIAAIIAGGETGGAELRSAGG